MSNEIVDKNKRTCPICEKAFDLMEYAFHVQEEQLLKLASIETLLETIKDITELTYAYMGEEDDRLDHVDSDNDNDSTITKSYLTDENVDNKSQIPQPTEAEIVLINTIEKAEEFTKND